MPRTAVRALAVAVAVSLALGCAEAPPRQVAERVPDGPLFGPHGAFALGLQAPLGELRGDRGEERPYRPGQVTYRAPDGQPVALPLRVRVRGNYRRRRETCDLPPLRLNFARRAVRGTLFRKQDKLKLVTHCRNARSHEQLLLLEYLAYRVFNLISDHSFRVRLVEMHYREQPSDTPLRRYGFLIEDQGRAAKRLGLSEAALPQADPELHDAAQLNRVEVFQYLIGNTDWSARAGARGEDCCHNLKLLRDAAGRLYALPYDFDMSGVVSAPYASPNPELPIRSVRQRLYRGYCATLPELDRTLDVFRAKRAAIQALYTGQPGLHPRQRARALRYYERFYATLDDPDARERAFVRACRN